MKSSKDNGTKKTIITVPISVLYESSVNQKLTMVKNFDYSFEVEINDDKKEILQYLESAILAKRSSIRNDVDTLMKKNSDLIKKATFDFGSNKVSLALSHQQASKSKKNNSSQNNDIFFIFSNISIDKEQISKIIDQEKETQAKEVAKKLAEQEKRAQELAKQKALEEQKKAQEAFETAKNNFTKDNKLLKVTLEKFNVGNNGEDVSDSLFQAINKAIGSFGELEKKGFELNELKQKKIEIPAELKEQKLYADFLDKKLKKLDGKILPKREQPDFMKGLSGSFYKPYERLLGIVNENSGKITDKEVIIKKLEELKVKGFALSGQIESNLETFFTRLAEEIEKSNEEKLSLQNYCAKISLTLNGDTGTGKTMFMESLLGSTDEKNKYFTNQQENDQQENGNFKKDGLADLGAFIYGENRQKFVIHCSKDFEEIKTQINANKDVIIAFDEWHLLTKEQKIALKPLLQDRNFIKITANPTDGLYKASKREVGDDKTKKQELLSAKEERKSKILENVVGAKNIEFLKLNDSYCLSIIDADGSLEKTNKDGFDTGDILNINIDFGNGNKKPQIIIFPPDEKGEYLVYTTSEENVNDENVNDEKYKQEKWDKNRLADELKIKTRIFQVFGPNSTQKGQTRGNIDGGDYGTSGKANQKILFYSFDKKIIEKLEGFLNSGIENLGDKKKADLIGLINKYDEFIVQAYGRARADIQEVYFDFKENKKLQEFHEQIQTKKADLLKDDLFKIEINGKDNLVDYNSFVDRFNKNLPQEDREKIIIQAFLKVASEENNGNLPKVAIEAVGDESEFNKVYNVIKNLSEKQREVLMKVGGYDKELLAKQDALTKIKTAINGEIEAKRKINKETKNNYYSDFRLENKIEDKISIKIASDGKVSLDGVGEGKFESLAYLNKNPQGKDTKLNEADANAFKGHIDRINIVIDIEKSVSKYQEIIDKLKELNLTEIQKSNIKKEAEDKIEAIKEQYKTTLDEKQLESIISALKDSSQDSSKINEMENFLKGLQEENVKLQKKQVELEEQKQQQIENNKAEIERLQKELEDVMSQSTAQSNTSQQQQNEMSENINKLELKNKALIGELEQQKQKETENQQKLMEEGEAIKLLQEKIKQQKNEDHAKHQELIKKLTENLEERNALQRAYEATAQAFEDFKNGLSSFLSVSPVNTLEEIEKQIKQLQEQQAKEIEKLQAELDQQKQAEAQLEAEKRALQEQQKLQEQQAEELREANNKLQKLQDKLKEKNQKIIQLEQDYSEKLEEKDDKFQTQEQLTKKVKGEIKKILGNKDSNGNIDALFENGELKTLYHTASKFEQIGQASVGFGYDENYYQSFLDIKNVDGQDEKSLDQQKFDLLRKSIIQSSAIREKHLILQEVLQENKLMNDGLKAYSFKSLDQLIDGDNFTDLFKAELGNVGFTEKDGVWIKGEGNSAFIYDTNQPYVKDFLINAYYEENFNKFKDVLGQEELNKLELLAVNRYNAKQKLEFVEQILNYQEVSMKQGNDLKELVDIKEKKDDFYKISNLITHPDIKDWQDRFKAESKAQEELEKIAEINKCSSKKIIVGRNAEFIVNESELLKLLKASNNDKLNDESNVAEDDFPSHAQSTGSNKVVRVNIGEMMTCFNSLDEDISVGKINISEFSPGVATKNCNYSDKQQPATEIKPESCENFLMKCIASIKTLIPNSEKVNTDLPSVEGQKQQGK